MAQNAVCKIAVDDIALDRQIVTNSDFTFSHVLDDWSRYESEKQRQMLDVRGVESVPRRSDEEDEPERI